jgi:carbon-monoxide dehydrogenase large subunit
MDPAELRRINTIPPSAMPFKTGLTFKYDSGEFEKNLTMALGMADYGSFERRRAEARKRGKLRGLGMSNTIEKAGSPGVEGAEIRFDRSGTATIFAGSVTTGQGHETVFKQIACDMFGLPIDDVQFVTGDTDKVPFGHGSGGSRSSSMGGSAVYTAATRIVEKATKIAAHLLEAKPEDVTLRDGVFSVASSNRSMTFKEVAKAAVNPKSVPDGMDPGLMASVVYASKAGNYPNGCHICELEIDPDTGTLEILNYSVMDDFGRALNPLLLQGQIHGGVGQGVGQALAEHTIYDRESGQLLSGSFMDYALPRADIVPPVKFDMHNSLCTTNPLGVKGAGEAGAIGAPPSVINAIVDAIHAHTGVKHVDMPVTPAALWAVIEAHRGRKAA